MSNVRRRGFEVLRKPPHEKGDPIDDKDNERIHNLIEASRKNFEELMNPVEVKKSKGSPSSVYKERLQIIRSKRSANSEVRSTGSSKEETSQKTVRNKTIPKKIKKKKENQFHDIPSDVIKKAVERAFKLKLDDSNDFIDDDEMDFQNAMRRHGQRSQMAEDLMIAQHVAEKEVLRGRISQMEEKVCKLENENATYKMLLEEKDREITLLKSQLMGNRSMYS